ncbi:MAG: hypothetical protein MRJ92_04955 [Nitrospira sp.]|nr:hypothetical protein [Nitrospira sp.]
MLPWLASGTPAGPTGGTLQAWLTEAALRIWTTIGLFACGLIRKFLWAPVMDRIVPPWLGRRRGWMMVTQTGLASRWRSWPSSDHPAERRLRKPGVGRRAFLSASQDIVCDAYRTDVLETGRTGIGAATWVMGYRIAMIVSGSLASILASHGLAGCLSVRRPV